MDIYNGVSGSWTTAQLSAARYYLAATSLPEQSLALFAGGYDGNGAGCCPTLSPSIFLSLLLFSLVHLDVSAVVDIFNAASGQWTVASLSAARSLLAAASLPEQNLVFFGGGQSSSGKPMCAVIRCFR